MDEVNKIEEFFKWYIKDFAECMDIKITDKEVYQISKELIENDELFETIDSEINEMFRQKGYTE